MSPETALQIAVLGRLTSSAAVIALVPAAAILDRNERPAPETSIIIGEGQSIDDGDSVARNRLTVFMDLHVWKKETSTKGVKAIAGEVRRAITSGRLDLGTGFHCIDCRVSGARYLRDPDGKTSHAVVTVEAKLEEN